MPPKLKITDFTTAALHWQDNQRPLTGTIRQQEREVSKRRRHNDAVREYFDGPPENLCLHYLQLVDKDRTLWWNIVNDLYNEEGVARIQATIEPWKELEDLRQKLAEQKADHLALVKQYSDLSFELGKAKAELEASEDDACLKAYKRENEMLVARQQVYRDSMKVLRQQLLIAKARAFDLSEKLRDLSHDAEEEA